jgi:hypothetical protein
MAVAQYIPQTDPYSTPTGFTETTTPGGGTAYNDPNGNMYVKNATGFTLYQPPTETLAPTSTSAVVTSEPARTATQTALQSFKQEPGIAPAGTGTATTNPAAPQEGQQYVFKDGQLQLSSPTTTQPSTQTTPSTTQAPTTNTQSSTDTQTPASTGNTEWDKFLATQTANQQAMATSLQQFQTQAAAVRAKLTSANQNLIDSISQSFANQVQAQKKVNDATLAGLTQTGIRAGRSRYESEAETSALSAEMTAGIQRIADLQGKRDSLIAQAQVAQTQEDWKMFYDSYSQAQQAAKEMNQSVIDMYKLRMENEKNAQDAVNQKLTNLKLTQDINAKTIDSIGYIALHSLTGNEQQDVQSIKSLAAQYGVDFTQLLSKVDELNTKNEKYTGTVGEYQFYADQARKSGQTPLSFTDYQAYQEKLKHPTANSSTTDSAGNTTYRTTSYSTPAFPGSTPPPTPSAPGKGPVAPGATGSAPATHKLSAQENTIANDVKAVLEGRNTLYNIRQTMGRSNSSAAYMQKVRDAINKIDPNFDYVASDAGGKAVSSSYYQKAIGSINSVLPNIDKIVQLSDQVKRLGVKGVDSLLQKGAIQLGNKKVSNFHEAQKLIADEIGVALGAGTVSDMKLQLGFDVTDPSVKPEVFASNMAIVKEFIQNRKKGLEELRYKSATTNTSQAGITVAGKFYSAGSIITGANGKKGRVNANGTITPL